MEALIIVLTIFVLALAWHRWSPKFFNKDVPSRSAAPVPSQRNPLSSRLHELAETMDPAVSASARPRELADLPEFNEAVRLLQDESVPLETVTQYALGDNFVLSCVGLSALAGRPDRARWVAEHRH